MSSVLGFYGGVGSVTGANFLLDTSNVAILVDCGLVQGDRFVQEVNAEPFVYNPSDVDFLLVTHAHADHIGRIPKLAKEGFKGVIYSTVPTRDFASIMLRDALKVMEYEHEKYGSKVIYEEADIDLALSLWKTVEYEEVVILGDGVTAKYTDAGHILGSGMISLVRDNKKIVFTGDVGNIPQPLLNSPVIPKEYEYMVIESVYGDRKHEEVKERSELLKHYIMDTQKKSGTLIIPAFSIERTQSMLLEINNMVESGEIQPLPVFLDSPLAIEVTEMYRKYPAYLKGTIQEQIKNGDDVFNFKGLSFTKSVKDSQDIHTEKGAKIIIAGSGMSHGGRIILHEKKYLGDKNTTLLLVGYQSIGSLGRLLQDGAKKIRIDGEDVKVRAKVATIRGFSGHADRDQLLNFVAEGGDKTKQVFVTMGEEKSSLFFVQRLRDYLGLNAVAPSLNEKVIIDF